jgi:methionine-rich copper-binding protein CopC
VALLGAGTRITSAHAKIVRSEPKDRATLVTAPKTIELWFNELLDDEFNTVEIYSTKDATAKSRKNLAKEKPKVDPKDRTHLTLTAPPLEPGGYAVEYRVLSRDGHSAPGRFTFTITGKS